MKTRYLILMLLKACDGSINSKTKLQKQLYLASLIMNYDLGYKAHYYGPYSNEVEEGLSELIGAGFMNMTRTVYGFNEGSGFEMKRYDFSLSPVGAKYADEISMENNEKFIVINNLVNKLKEIGDPDYISLSLASKAYYILKNEGNSLKKNQIVNKAKEFNWDINDRDVEKAVEILVKLGFAEEK